MLKLRTLLIFVVGALTLSSILASLAQPLQEVNARSAFEGLGCTRCHDGGRAPRWEVLVVRFISWGERYTSIDEALRRETRFESFDVLRERMASNAGKSKDDPQVVFVFDYLKSVFERGKGAPPTTVTVTNTITRTITAVEPRAERTVTLTELRTSVQTTTITQVNWPISILLLIIGLVVGGIIVRFLISR